MPNRYEQDDRPRQGRYQRPGQAEQFQSNYDRDPDRSQMGESGRGDEYEREANAWSSDDRYDFGHHRDSGNPYRQGYGSGGGSVARDRTGGGYGSSPSDRNRFGSGDSSQYARGEEWHQRNRSGGSRQGSAIPHDEGTDQDRGLLERAGNTLARWLGDDADYGRGSSSHRGRGPANYTRSDDRVLEDACDALTQDHWVDARNVQVTVQKGEVTLDGTVASRDQKRRAEDCVEHLSGVKHVQNNLRVQESQARDRTESGGGTGGSSSPNTGSSGAI